MVVEIKNTKNNNLGKIEMKETSIDTKFNFRKGKLETNIKSDNPKVERVLPFIFIFVLIIIIIFTYFVITKLK